MLIDSLVRMFVPLSGLRANLRIESVSVADESFARICRQTENIEVDRVMLQLARKGKEWIFEYCELIASVFDDKKYATLDNITESDVVDLIALNEMAKAVTRTDRHAGDITWNGDSGNSVSNYRECNGLVKRLDSHARYINYLDWAQEEYIKKNEELEWCAVGYPFAFSKHGPAALPPILHIGDLAIEETQVEEHTFLSNMYILPLSKKPGDDGIYEQRVDYNSKSKLGDNYFLTDDGEFLWEIERSRWDMCLNCQTEFRIVVPKPELVTIIKDVPVVYTLREEMQCQQQL